MAVLRHEVWTRARPERVLPLLTTKEGLRSWWTADAEAKPEKGSIAVFGFDRRSTVFRMRVLEISSRRVVWKCLGEEPQWKGTRLVWDISRRGKWTLVRLAHGGWRRTSGYFTLCNTTWGALLYRLKDRAEGKRPGPFFAQ